MLAENEKAENEKKAVSITGLAENFGKVISPELMRMWIKLLEPYSAALVERAALRVILEYEYKTLPPFAVLRKALDAESSASSPSCARPEIQAAAEWNKLLEDISKRGVWRGVPESLHPVTEFVLRGMGGWTAACQWRSDKLEYIEKQFVSRWKEAAENSEFLQIPALSAGAAPAGMIEGKNAVKACLAALETELRQERA